MRRTGPSLPSDDGIALLTDGNFICASMEPHGALPSTSSGTDHSTSGCCWTASSDDHNHHHMPPYFRLFLEESAGYGGLLQQPTCGAFDVLSSDLPDDAHVRSVEDFVPSTARYNCYSTCTTSGNTVNNMSNNLSSSEFIPPTAAAAAASSRPISSSSTILTFQSNMSKLAAPALPDGHPSDNSDTHIDAKKPSDEANLEKQGEENEATKRARIHADQCIAATDPAQLQAINKVQSARSKEKLGERINALQQLVSPFGKTDTASVLSEAIGYIKFLQEQVQVLSSPYMKPTVSNRQEGENASDLRSRGLCLVPVSCTLNVANNNGADYWASSVGGGGGHSRYSASSN